VHNPISRMSELVLLFLERIFIPRHLRIPPEADVGILERLKALLRRPLVLAILAIVLVLLIILIVLGE
jgi:hypothetical protein